MRQEAEFMSLWLPKKDITFKVMEARDTRHLSLLFKIESFTLFTELRSGLCSALSNGVDPTPELSRD